MMTFNESGLNEVPPAVSIPRGAPIGIYLPYEVVYCDGTSATLPKDYVLKEGNLRLFVPKTEDVVNAMKTFGFHEDGETLVMNFFYDIWDLRVKIYDDGFIDGRLEVSQKYRRYSYNYAVPSIYEVFEFYRTVFNNLHIFDNVASKWIKEVRAQYLVTLNAPSYTSSPIMVIAGPLSVIGIIAYPLSRLTCP